MTGRVRTASEMAWRGLRAALLVLALFLAPLAADGPVRVAASGPSLVHLQPALVGLVAEAPGLPPALAAAPMPLDVPPTPELPRRTAHVAVLPAALPVHRVPTLRGERPAVRAPPEMMPFA